MFGLLLLTCTYVGSFVRYVLIAVLSVYIGTICKYVSASWLEILLVASGLLVQ